MGYDLNRFTGCEVDEELICAICSSVLEDPLQAPECEHAFCSVCIKEWLNRKNTCPIDRRPLTVDKLKTVPRILKNLLSRLQIVCDHVEFGCKEVIKLESLSIHLKECQFNPNRPVECEGCGLVITKDQIQDHHCIKALKGQIDELTERMNALQQYIRQELPNSLIPFMNTTRLAQRQQQLIVWSNSLPLAKVLRWGSLISTPNASLLTKIRNSLLEAGCPSNIIDDLMENSHESKWPIGLSTLEIRQINRPLFNNYVCRKITSMQAVVVISSENQHMNSDLIVEPGLVLIFAHGIVFK